MSDHLMRGFRVQLTTTMDSVLRTALFEVMKIFENALHDHKIQLAQKGEEIAQLKTKLQRAELKLKDLELGCPGQAEISQTQKQAKLVPGVPGWSSTIPRSDVAAPDDWCAPLGYETVTKQEVNLYPDVKLRPFSIRLCHVPVKTEVVKCPINLQRKKPSRRSERISVFNTKSEKVPNKSKSDYDQSHQSPVQRCGVDVLLKDVRHIYSDLSGLERLRKRKGSRETLTDKENPNGQRNRAANKSKSTETERARKYPCSYCNKVYIKEFRLRIHVKNSHKKCQGCKKPFRYVESVKFHQEFCAKYKKLMEKKVCNPPKTCKEDDVSAPYKTQVTVKEETTETPVNSTAAFSLRHTCGICNYTFKSKHKLNEHMRVHSINRFLCSMCPKIFLSIGALKSHKTKLHKDHAHALDTKEDLGWTRPLEDMEDD